MKKFVLLSFLFTLLLGDCFCVKRLRDNSDDDGKSAESTAQRARVLLLSKAELFTLADNEFLTPEILGNIQYCLNEYLTAPGTAHIDTIVDADGRTLLSRVKNADYARILISFGAQVNTPGYSSPLFYAITEAREGVAYFLITACRASIDNLAVLSPISPSIIVLAGRCSDAFRAFLIAWRQQQRS